MALPMIAACGGKGSSGASSDLSGGDTIPLKYATNLTLVSHGDFTEAIIRNPWDTTAVLHRYILADKSVKLPDNLPEATVVRTPLSNALVYSTVHTGLLENLGALESIGGVCNSEYVTDSLLLARIKDGKTVDCGNSMAPDIEKIILMNPEAILLSPYENNDKYGKVGNMGIPIIECADYMENSPLARAEWMKFYGMLVGKEHAADSLFQEIDKNYTDLNFKVALSSYLPMVLMDQKYDQVWNVPAGRSTMGIYIRDAGGYNPFERFDRAGSVALSPEQVLADAHDADIWLVRYNQKDPLTLSQLASGAGVNSQFKAFKEGNVYGCNTAYVPFYDETPFHPDLLLADMISIFHPELNIVPTKKYFSKLKE